MEKNDAPTANAGISKELLRDIVAQHAIIDYAVKLINQHHQELENESQLNKPFGEWVYNMTELDKLSHLYAERKKLTCPHCKEPEIFNCDNCGNEFEYHDEL
jgi:primosomal protein N'